VHFLTIISDHIFLIWETSILEVANSGDFRPVLQRSQQVLQRSRLMTAGWTNDIQKYYTSKN
jgi:hypothetical protein